MGRDCNPYLLEQTWVFLRVNLVALVCCIVHCAWPLLLPLFPKSTMTRDSEDLTQAYLAIDYNADRFKDDAEHCFPCCCPICLEAFAPGQDIVGTPCSGRPHIFHRHCLRGWLCMNDSCPGRDRNVENLGICIVVSGAYLEAKPTRSSVWYLPRLWQSEGRGFDDNCFQDNRSHAK